MVARGSISAQTSFNLSESYNNYKSIEIRVWCSNYDDVLTIPTSDIEINARYGLGLYFSSTYNFHAAVYFTTDTACVIRDVSAVGWDTSVGLVIKGIKS